ncbi:MAG: alpha/beta fold hydrolase [Marmoricola sp.]
MLNRSARSWSTNLGSAGQTSRPVVGNYYRHAADHVIGLLDELGIEKAHVLGNSLGGGTAMRLALSHPDRVERLVLMGPWWAVVEPVPR